MKKVFFNLPKLFRRKRRVWKIRPTTRVKESSKVYSRRKAKEEARKQAEESVGKSR